MLLFKRTLLCNTSVLFMKHQTRWTDNIFIPEITPKVTELSKNLLRSKQIFTPQKATLPEIFSLKSYVKNQSLTKTENCKVHLHRLVCTHQLLRWHKWVIKSCIFSVFCLKIHVNTSITSFDFMYPMDSINLIREYGLFKYFRMVTSFPTACVKVGLQDPILVQLSF